MGLIFGLEQVIFGATGPAQPEMAISPGGRHAPAVSLVQNTRLPTWAR